MEAQFTTQRNRVRDEQSKSVTLLQRMYILSFDKVLNKEPHPDIKSVIRKHMPFVDVIANPNVKTKISLRPYTLWVLSTTE